MLDILTKHPLLLLFVVAAVGYPIGKIRFRGSSLGVASVLFVGIAIGSLDPKLRLPDIIYELGLVLFVYVIGLSSGPGFFQSFRRKGLRDNLLVAGVIGAAAGLTILAFHLFHFKPTMAVGMFTGALTNTPALAGILETIRNGVSKEFADQLLAEPVIGYSIVYPMGVIGMIVAISLCQWMWKIDYAKEAEGLRRFGLFNEKMSARTIRVTHPVVVGRTIGEMMSECKWDVVFGRVKRGELFDVGVENHKLAFGELVVVVGGEEELEKTAAHLGEFSREHIEYDSSELVYRRIFVSNPKSAGRRIADLNLGARLGAVVTRVRRGDTDTLVHPDTILELGDRVRVVAHRDRMDDVTRFFGDSYRAVSEVDILTFSLGLAIGMLAGAMPIPLGGEITVKLGFAGGPLVVGLILGRVGHTGSMVWTLPYSASLTLRQIGLVLFLAGIGTKAGYGFASTFTQGGGLTIFAVGAAITCFSAFAMLWIGYRVFKIPMSLLTGMLAGMQTQPALLGYALEQTKNDLPNIGYAEVYPAATILKILAAQLLLTLLAR